MCGQPAPHACTADIPCYLGALTKKPASPSRVLCTWVADSHSKAEERPGQQVGNAGLSPWPLPACFCQVQRLCWALGFSWPCLAGRRLSQRVFSAEHPCKRWQRWRGCGSTGAPLAGRVSLAAPLALQSPRGARTAGAPPPASACPKLSTVE